MTTAQPSLPSSLSRGLVAGLAGTLLMTAFQKLVEMPLTSRGESDAPARFAETVLPIKPGDARARRRLNYTAHFGVGGMWGVAFALAGRRGLRGQRAVNAVFAAFYTGDVLLNTALGVYQPSRWSPQDWAVDILDKYLQAQATGATFDLLRQDRAATA